MFYKTVQTCIVLTTFVKCRDNFYSFFNRDEISACLEKSYQRISFQEAQRMLYLDSEKDIKAFAVKVVYFSCFYSSLPGFDA